MGARPNFVKAAPLLQCLENVGKAEVRLIHTGQHTDFQLSDVFFKDLGIREPDINLGVSGGKHAEQTARIMIGYEPVCMSEQPDLVVVFGDVNSTLAGALVAKKCGSALAHIEAGLRSGDRTMPEEINRLAVDAISDLLLTTSDDASLNLIKEGQDESKIVLVGNLMIDSLLRQANKDTDVLQRFKLASKSYIVTTLHRPSNVDDISVLSSLVNQICSASGVPVVFPVHPRTAAKLDTAVQTDNLLVCEPLGYCDFITLIKNASAIVTDSGGIQEEASTLNIPCLTMRTTTERPITISLGTNRLVSKDTLDVELSKALSGDWPVAKLIPLWDGNSAQRTALAIDRFLENGV